MGYTNYWTPKTLKPGEIPAQFWEEAERVLDKVISKGVILADVTGDHKVETGKELIVAEEGKILFNGYLDESHESFALDFVEGEWNFCKTVRKPYDLAVKAILMLADKYELLDDTDDGYGWSWDGDEKDTEYIDAQNLMVELELI